MVFTEMLDKAKERDVAFATSRFSYKSVYEVKL